MIAAEGIIGVPVGTAGRVTAVNGFRWVRYWVSFENGVSQGSIDRALLTRVDRKGAVV